MKINEFAPLAGAATALKSLGGAAARTIAKKLAPKAGSTATGQKVATKVGQSVGRRIGAGRNPVQDRGTGGAFSGNPPKNSLGSIGAMPGAKKASIGSGNNSNNSPTTADTTRSTSTTGTQSAADMRNSASNEIDTGSASTAGTQDMQTTQSNTVEPEELKTGDQVTVKVKPGDKNLTLVYPDETEALVPRDLLQIQQVARMKELAGIQQ